MFAFCPRKLWRSGVCTCATLSEVGVNLLVGGGRQKNKKVRGAAARLSLHFVLAPRWCTLRVISRACLLKLLLYVARPFAVPAVLILRIRERMKLLKGENICLYSIPSWQNKLLTT